MKLTILTALTFIIVSANAFADSKVCGKVSRISAHAKISEIEIGIEGKVDGFMKETRVAVQKDLRDAALALVSTSQLTDREVCVSTVLDSNKGYEVARSIELNMSKKYIPVGNL
jgi:hypothetical protein